MYTHKESHFVVFFVFSLFTFCVLPVVIFFFSFASIRHCDYLICTGRCREWLAVSYLQNVAVEKIDLLQRELSAFSTISFWGSNSTFGDFFRSISSVLTLFKWRVTRLMCCLLSLLSLSFVSLFISVFSISFSLHEKLRAKLVAVKQCDRSKYSDDSLPNSHRVFLG